MPAIQGCTPSCGTTLQTVNTPGDAGANAFTTLSANLTIPAVDATVVATVGSTDWMAVGQIVFASDEIDVGHFEVTSINSPTSVTLTFKGYEGDASAAAIIGSGGKVVPSGTQPSIADPLPIANGGTGAATQAGALSNILGGAPLPIANGGTAGATKAAALSALGVGQVALVSTLAGLSYDITNSPAQITGSTVTTVSTGTYLVLAHVTVLYTGTTFAASRTLTITVRNTTDGANLVSCARATGLFTLTDQPSIDYVLPFTTQSLTAAKTFQLYISLDTVESAGSSVVTAASLCLLPLAI